MQPDFIFPTLETRVFVRAAQRMQQTIDSAAANLAALQLADKLASQLNTCGLQAASDCDEQAQPFLVLQVPIETLGHVDAEALVQMAANALGVAIEFNQERETYLVRCGEAMAQGMPLLLQEV